METNDNIKKRVGEVLIALLAVLTVFVGVKVISDVVNFGYTNYDKMPHNTISVSGKGEVVTVPDIATFSFSSTENAATVAAAQKKVTDTMNKAFDFLKKNGVAEKDIQNSGYNIYPKYDYVSYPCTSTSCRPSKQVLSGYEVSQTFTIKIRDISKSGDILAGIGELGVNNVSGLSFSVDKQDDFVAQARKKAIDDAQSKADILAKDLGVKIVRIVSFSENGASPIYYDKMVNASYGLGMASSVAPSPVIPAGENKITSQVSITYEIK